MPNPENLSRAGGRPYTDRPRVYVGCLPCQKGRYVLDIETANDWLRRHWKICPRTEILRARAESP